MNPSNVRYDDVTKRLFAKPERFGIGLTNAITADKTKPLSLDFSGLPQSLQAGTIQQNR